jgi:hypothetical protein
MTIVQKSTRLAVALLTLTAFTAGCGDGDDALGPNPAVARISFGVEPSDATAGAAIAPRVRVALWDAAGSIVLSADDEVTVSLADNPAGGSLLGTWTVSAQRGVADFEDLSIETAGTGFTLEARLGSLSATSAAFTIEAAAPAQLAFASQPAGAAAGTPIAPPVQVEIQDEFGNVVTAATDDVTIGLEANPGSMVFHASGMSSGSAVLQLVDPITPQALPPLPGSQTYEVSGMVFDPQAGDVIAIEQRYQLYRFDPLTGAETFVGDLDRFEQRALAFDGDRLLVAGMFGDEIYELNPATATTTLIGQVMISTDSITGFNGLATDPTDGKVYAVVQLVGNANRKVRNLVRLDLVTLTATTVGTLTETGVAGIAFLPSGQLLAVTGDGAANPETLWTVDKTQATMTSLLALGLGDDGEAITVVPARLTGTLTNAAVAGVASFDDLQIHAPATSYTLTVSAPGLAPATSLPFNITP